MFLSCLDCVSVCGFGFRGQKNGENGWGFLILKFLLFFIVGYAYISHLAHTLFFCPQHGMVWCGCFYFIYFVLFYNSFGTGKVKMGGCLCFLCLVLYSLIIPHCFIIHLCIYSILPVDAKAYAYPALVNSPISSFLIQLARVCSFSLPHVHT